ncbi:hypothetical protein BHE90_016608, partial [Fusarium euwallaceae]
MEPGEHRILRLCSDIGPSEGPDGQVPDDQPQIGFPVLPAAHDPWRFVLLRAWLDRCTKNHGCHDRGRGKLPTRLLDIGGQGAPSILRLVLGQTTSDGKYVALSHCWGKTEPGKVPSYCTTKKNIGDREKEFPISDLPATFRDAIEVTRQLGLRYLWIDSLCIIQGDKGDWGQEAKRMEDVYRSAYCTLAATSAIDSNSGFLERTINSEYICVQDDSGRRVYVCTNPADFDTDVEGAQLNARAWVMQERFLSSRTIHFGAHQMYWECGKGVCYEDLTLLTSSRGNKRFKLDPQFPLLLQRSGIGPTIHFLQSLLEDYSNRGLSIPTDRAVALAGLEARIATALQCRSYGYGAFDFCLHRNLLWQRTDPQKERIQYETGKEVPSWSWMAYEGGIRFIGFEELPYDQLDKFNPLIFYQRDQEKVALLTK